MGWLPFLLQGIVWTQGSNPHLLSLLRTCMGSLPPAPPEKPSETAELSTKAGCCCSGRCWPQKQTHARAHQLCTQIQGHTCVGTGSLPMGDQPDQPSPADLGNAAGGGLLGRGHASDQTGPGSRLPGPEPMLHVSKNLFSFVLSTHRVTQWFGLTVLVNCVFEIFHNKLSSPLSYYLPWKLIGQLHFNCILYVGSSFLPSFLSFHITLFSL